MKVVLLDNIRGIGRVGDIKDVSDGYARNFLLPRGLGKPATEGAVKDAEAVKAQKLEASALADSEARALAARMEGVTVTIAGKANKQGKLFAGIEAAQIAQAISAVAGAQIATKQVRLDGPLKTAGEHSVVIELTADIQATVTVSVTAQ